MITTRLMKAGPKFLRREPPYLWTIQSVDYLHFGEVKNSAETRPSARSYSGQSHGTHGIAYFRDPSNTEHRNPENFFSLKDPDVAAVIHLVMPDGTAIAINHLGFTRVVSGLTLENWGFGDGFLFQQPREDDSHIPIPATAD